MTESDKIVNSTITREIVGYLPATTPSPWVVETTYEDVSLPTEDDITYKMIYEWWKSNNPSAARTLMPTVKASVPRPVAALAKVQFIERHATGAIDSWTAIVPVMLHLITGDMRGNESALIAAGKWEMCSGEADARGVAKRDNNHADIVRGMIARAVREIRIARNAP